MASKAVCSSIIPVLCASIFGGLSLFSLLELREESKKPLWVQISSRNKTLYAINLGKVFSEKSKFWCFRVT